MHDDRKEFEIARRVDAERMVSDKDLASLADSLFARSDQYNYSYMWNWCGLPMIQLPPDIVTLQEIVWESKPTVIIETGIARGGSLIFYSSILQLLGSGRVIGIDIDIRSHNRDAIEAHPLSHRITMIEGSSVDEETLEEVGSLIGPSDKVMVVLDSNHAHNHVLRELEFYAPLVTEGNYLVVADTILNRIPKQMHRLRDWGPEDNPGTALDAYLQNTDRFVRDPWINSKTLFTNSPGAYLKCVKS